MTSFCKPVSEKRALTGLHQSPVSRHPYRIISTIFAPSSHDIEYSFDIMRWWRDGKWEGPEVDLPQQTKAGMLHLNRLSPSG